MKKIIVISILLISFFSCDKRFPEYTEKDDDVYMKLLSFEEGNKAFKTGNYTKASIKFIANDTLIYQNFKEEIITPTNNKFDFVLAYLNEGDSADFMISAIKIKHKFKELEVATATTDYIRVIVKVYQYMSSQEHEKMNTNLDKEMKEQLLLKNYLKENNITSKHFSNGIYTQQLKKGKGQEIKEGSAITINYKGYFINQLEFDNSYKDIPLTFVYGTPDQVIKGLDIAIKGMKKGEKSKIIIPSQLAFGEVGSTTQIVPPYTTVIYELEIVNVK